MKKWRLRWLLVAFVGMHGLAAAVHPTGAEERVIGKDEIVESIEPRTGTRGVGVVPAPGTTRSDAPRKIALPAIQFEFNSDRLTRTARAQVVELGKALYSAALRRFSFTVVGHTDSVGAAEYNRRLSLRRARAVKRALVAEMGIGGDRLIEVGLGENYPIHGLAPENDRNRRVEVANLGALAPRANSEENASPHKAAGVGRRDRRVPACVASQRAGQRRRGHGRVSSPSTGVTTKAIFGSCGIRRPRGRTYWRRSMSGSFRAQGPATRCFCITAGMASNNPTSTATKRTVWTRLWCPWMRFVTNDGRVEGMITDDEIRALLDRIPAQDVQVVVDACHAGTSTRDPLGGQLEIH